MSSHQAYVSHSCRICRDCFRVVRDGVNAYGSISLYRLCQIFSHSSFLICQAHFPLSPNVRATLRTVSHEFCHHSHRPRPKSALQKFPHSTHFSVSAQRLLPPHYYLNAYCKAIPTEPNGGNHTPEFAVAARTQEAHDATMTTTKGLSLTGFRVLNDTGFFERVSHTSSLSYLS
jgi:hypothetical protein